MTELDILEQKINLVVQLIDKLASENQILKQENLSLTQQLKEKERLIVEGDPEITGIAEQEELIKKFREKEKKIRIKIKRILQKLENFEKLSKDLNNL